jgi:hypothetical protein
MNGNGNAPDGPLPGEVGHISLSNGDLLVIYLRDGLMPIYPRDDEELGPDDDDNVRPVHVLEMTPEEARMLASMLDHSASHIEEAQERS